MRTVSSRRVEVKGDWLLSVLQGLRGLETRGTAGKWDLEAHLIHQSVLAQIGRDGSCRRLLFADRPCLFINELHH